MKLGFYGCGNMGEAILSAIRKNGAHKISDVIILGRDLGRMGKLEKTYHVRTTSNVSDLQECDIIILGVKPQSLKDIPVFESKKKIIVSCAKQLD